MVSIARSLTASGMVTSKLSMPCTTKGSRPVKLKVLPLTTTLPARETVLLGVYVPPMEPSPEKRKVSPSLLWAPPLKTILLIVLLGALVLKSTKTRSSPSSPLSVTVCWAATSLAILKVSSPPAASTRKGISNVPPLNLKTSSLSLNKTRSSASRTLISISMTNVLGSETKPSETEPYVFALLRPLSLNNFWKSASQVAVCTGNNWAKDLAINVSVLASWLAE